MGIFNRTTKLKWRRRFRRGRRQVEDFGVRTEEQLERNFIRRLNNLWMVRRFLGTWIALIVFLMAGVILQTRALDSYYQSVQPASGGTYTEGILGSFTNVNPLYASGSVDSSVSRLIFAGLFKYDEQNNLIPDLASKWAVDPTGTEYTVTLKPHLLWQDNQPLTADDVVFTYQSIQNPDARSPFETSWKGVKVVAKDAHTVTFTLPNVLNSFPYSLTNGIVPKHILKDIPPAQLRSASFNTQNPVGAGPFRWERLEVAGTTLDNREERVALLPFDSYHDGRPKLNQFIVRAFHNEKTMTDSFAKKELNAVVGLVSTPDTAASLKSLQELSIPLTGEVMVFFKTTEAPLNDTKIRRALDLAANPAEVMHALGYPVVPVDEPILRGQLGYDPKLAQSVNNPTQAAQLLDEDGWKLESDGFRYKDKVKLGFPLYSEGSSDYIAVAQILQKQWKAVGVDVQVQYQTGFDLQFTLSKHEYGAILYGISVGNDPDVFAYWHSSQASLLAKPALNLSEYKSSVADKALEAGRTRSDPSIRAVKYRPFLQAWHDDAPALGLYQPRFLYLTNGKVYGLQPKSMNTGIDRYANVQNWMIREVKGVK